MNARAGFALPLVLAAIAVLSVSLLAFGRTEGSRARQAMNMDAEWRAETLAASVEARVAYLLTTEPLGARALVVGAPEAGRVVMLDGRPYDVPGLGAIVALQDEAGLVNLNGRDSDAVARLLQQAGAGEPDVLAARLADAIDGDDLRRAGGAEKADYARADAPAPPDSALADPRQMYAVLGWRALDAGARRLVGENVAALSPDAWFNPNTATVPALRAVFGIDAKAADNVIAQRERQSLLTRDEVMALTGAADVGSQIRASPARSFALVIGVSASPSQESYVYARRLRIAEEGSDRPVLVDRSEAPARVFLRERARANVIGVLDTFPETTRLRAP